MTLKRQYIQVADKKDYFLSCNFKWESQARQSLRLRTFLFGSITGCEKSTTVHDSITPRCGVQAQSGADTVTERVPIRGTHDHQYLVTHSHICLPNSYPSTGIPLQVAMYSQKSLSPFSITKSSRSLHSQRTVLKRWLHSSVSTWTMGCQELLSIRSSYIALLSPPPALASPTIFLLIAIDPALSTHLPDGISVYFIHPFWRVTLRSLVMITCTRERLRFYYLLLFDYEIITTSS